MAHLEVQPKPPRPWWVWLIIAVLVLVLAGMLIKKCSTNEDMGSPNAALTELPNQTLI